MMEKLTCMTNSGKSEITIGLKWTEVWGMVDLNNTIIITDTNVNLLYGDKFQKTPVITIPAGEGSKSIATVESVLKELLFLKVDRSTFILGIGGGVVCDIVGFVASIYMRGVRFGFVSTTLLSQVDASIGGKNGVNLNGIKNIVGLFSQPEFVICDPAMITTLPEKEFISGLGEVVKHALIRDVQMLGYIEENVNSILNRDLEVLENLISASVRIKAEIVGRDDNEKGERRLLNFGHTAGHAIEALTGLPHGLAIAHGMIIACEISYDDGMLEFVEMARIRALFDRMGLLPHVTISNADVISLIVNDKKRVEENFHFVYLRKPGEAIVKVVPVSEISRKLSERVF